MTGRATSTEILYGTKGSIPCECITAFVPQALNVPFNSDQENLSLEEVAAGVKLFPRRTAACHSRDPGLAVKGVPGVLHVIFDDATLGTQGGGGVTASNALFLHFIVIVPSALSSINIINHGSLAVATAWISPCPALHCHCFTTIIIDQKAPTNRIFTPLSQNPKNVPIYAESTSRIFEHLLFSNMCVSVLVLACIKKPKKC